MPINYNPSSPQTLAALRAIDETFKAGAKLADVDASADYVYRCEVPYNHHVSFNQTAIINELPRHLHEHRDVNKPHRLAFDIEREVSLEQFEKILVAFPGQRPSRVIELWCETVIQHIMAAINRVVSAKYLGKFATDADGKRRKIQAEELHPTILESCRNVPDNWLRLIKEGRQLAPPKLSYHLVYRDIWLLDGREAQSIAEAVCKDLASIDLAPLAKYIDCAIYKRLYFRAYGSSKPTEPTRILRRVDEADVEYVSDCYNLQRIYRPPTHIFPYKKRKEQPAAQPNNGGLPEELADLVEQNAEILRGFTLNQKGGKFIRLIGSGDSFCAICKRNHRGHMQNYIMRTKAGFEFRCSHNDAKGKQPIMLRSTLIAREFEQHAPAILAGMGTFTGAAHRDENTTRVNQRYLTNELAQMYDDGGRLLFVSSAMGTGKTFGLRKFIDAVGNKTACMLSFRKAFTAEKAKDLGFKPYYDINGSINIGHTALRCAAAEGKDNDEDDDDYVEYPRVIVQVESLGRINSCTPPQIVIIDEIESIMEQLNKTNGNNYQSSVEEFKSIIAHAECIILMDANLSDYVIDYFTRIRQDLRYRILLNDYKHAGISAKIYTRESSVMDAFCDFIIGRGPACMCSDSKTLLDLTRDRLIEKGVPAADIFVASSETAEERARLVDEFGTMTVVVSRYKAFLYNTTLLAGVSIEDPSKRNLFAIFKSDFITPTAAVQLIGRVRGVETLHLAAVGAVVAPRSRKEHIAILMRNSADNLFANATERRKAPPLLKLYASNSACREFGQSALQECLVVLLARHGYAIEFSGARGRQIIGALVKTKNAELDRILDAARTGNATGYMAEKLSGASHMCVPKEYMALMTKDDLRIVNDPDIRLAYDNLNYIAKSGGQFMEIAQRYDIRREHSSDMEATLAAATGESNAANTTGLAVAFLRHIGADLSGATPIIGAVPRDTWQAKLSEFLAVNGMSAKNTSLELRKINKVLSAAFGLRFAQNGRETVGGKRVAASYVLESTGDFTLVGGADGWELAMISRLRTEFTEKQKQQQPAN